MNKTYIYFIGGIILAVAVTLIVQNSITGKASYSVFQEDADDSSQYSKQAASKGSGANSALATMLNAPGRMGGDGSEIEAAAPVPTKCSDVTGDYWWLVYASSNPEFVSCAANESSDACLVKILDARDKMVPRAIADCEVDKRNGLTDAGNKYALFSSKCNLAGRFLGKKCTPDQEIKDMLSPCKTEFCTYLDDDDDAWCKLLWNATSQTWTSQCSGFNGDPIPGKTYRVYCLAVDGSINRKFTCKGDPAEPTGTPKDPDSTGEQ